MSAADPAAPQEPSGGASQAGAPHEGGGSSDDLSGLSARLLAGLSGAIETRVQLAALEFRQERDRAHARLGFMLLISVAAGLALLAVNALVAALLWPVLGAWSLAVLALIWSVIAGLAALRLRRINQEAPRPFDASLQTLERDRAWLSRALGKRR